MIDTLSYATLKRKARSLLFRCRGTRAFWAVTAPRHYQQNLGRLRSFRDRHPGQRCFVIGNGPSLSPADLERLTGEVTFATNKIYRLFDQTSWRPTYYVAEDDHFITQHRDEIRRCPGAAKFLNAHWRHLFGRDDELIWYPYRWVEPPVYPRYPRFSVDAQRGLYSGYMVTYICLQLAFYMGFTRVFLLGVDFAYSLTSGGPATITHAADHPRDHFAPDYFRPGELRNPPFLDHAEAAMRCARDTFAAHGRSIWNSTRGGKLEVFPRLSLEEALRD